MSVLQGWPNKRLSVRICKLTLKRLCRCFTLSLGLTNRRLVASKLNWGSAERYEPGFVSVCICVIAPSSGHLAARPTWQRTSKGHGQSVNVGEYSFFIKF